MAQTDVNFEFAVYCTECGAELKADFNYSKDLEVEPCTKCIDNAKDEGYEEGRADAE